MFPNMFAKARRSLCRRGWLRNAVL